MKKTLTYCLLFFMLGAVSCKNDEISEPAANFDETTVSVNNGAGKFTMYYTANVNWVVSATEPWLTVTPDYGSGTLKKYLEVSYEENKEVEDRSADLVFTMWDGTELGRKTVFQAAAAKEIQTPSTVNVSVDGGPFTIEIAHNIDFQVDIQCDWITRAETKAMTTTNLELFASENRGETEREALVIVTAESLCDTVKVIQACGSSDIPVDPVLLKVLLPKYDKDGNGHLSYFEAKEVTEIVICEPNYLGIPSGKGVSSFKGVENLPSLEVIKAGRNALTEVDLSACASLKYLDVSYNTITSLVLPPSLEYLDCSHNQISSLDVSGCKSLEYLECGENNISKLDVSACPKLKTLAFYNNKVSEIDVKSCPELETLICYLNALSTLDLSQNTGLVTLNCSYDGIKDLSIACPSTLVTLDCPGNRIGELNLSSYAVLRSLGCDNNQISSLNVSGCTSLVNLYAWHNNITTLDVSGLGKLQNLGVAFNNMSELKLTGCKSLRGLFVQNNALTSLNTTGLSALNNVYCHDNRIASLDMKDCPELYGLHAGNNALVSLDLSTCGKLVTMYCTGNSQLKEVKAAPSVNPDVLYWYKDAGTVFKSVEVTVTRTSGTWEAGSSLAVMSAGGNAVNSFTLTSGAGSSKATFSGTNIPSGKQIYAIYPVGSVVSFANTSATIRIPSSFTYAEAPEYSILAGKSASNGGDVTINTANSYIKLNITGTGTLSSVVVSASQGQALSGDFSIDLAGNAAMTAIKGDAVSVSGINKALGSAPIAVTVPVSAGSNRMLDITLYDTDGKGMAARGVSCAATPAGSTVDVAIKYVPQDTDINLSAAGYANSYIVSALGKYSFDARKVDGTALNGVRADWLWKTDADIISNVSYANGTISFSASGTKGNAGIALLDASGNVVWSWHIWCTDKPKECKWNANTWLDRNLGATSCEVCPESYGLHYQWGRKDPFMGSSIMGSAAAAGKELDLDGNTIVNTDIVGAGNGWKVCYGESTMENATRYPLCFYAYVTSASYINSEGDYGGKTTYYGTYNASAHPYLADWLDTGETFSGDRWYNTSVTTSGKTNYDPCPPGYQVPPKAKSDADMIAMYFPKADVTTAANTAGQFGPDGFWLPAAGIRGAGASASQGNGTPNDGGQLWRIGQYGIYWTATSNTAYCNAWQFNITVNGISAGNSSQWKAYGFPIRCVSETK